MKNKNKVLGIMIIMAMVLTAVFALAACPNDYECECEAGGEVGLYRCAVGGHQINLMFRCEENGGNHFILTMIGAEGDLTGRYRLSGTQLTLEFDGETANVAATLSNDVVAMNFGGQSLRMYRQVSRRVEFVANGGSEIEPESVMNGTAIHVSRQAALTPTRDGYHFLGWFRSAGLTGAPFVIGTDIVSSNMTLFASWHPIGVNAQEFDIEFDWNFVGEQENLQAMRTEAGGRLFNFPDAMTRTGYTFEGWWVSMLEDGSRLTHRAYVNDTVFVENATLFAYWRPVSPGQLYAPLLSISREGEITWEGVTNGTGFDIRIIPPAGSTTGPTNATPAPGDRSFNYSFNNLNAPYVIELTARGAVGVVPATARRYFINRALPRVSNFDIVGDNFITFLGVPNAPGNIQYRIRIECANEAHGEWMNLGTATSISFAGRELGPDGIRFFVEASAPGWSSSIGVYEFNRILDPVAAINFDLVNQVASWTAVRAAQNYIVYIREIGEEEPFLVENNFNATSFQLRDLGAGEFEMRVIPRTPGFNVPLESIWFPFTLTGLAAPANVRLDGNVIRWDAVIGAESYTISIGNIAYFNVGGAYNYHELTSAQLNSLRDIDEGYFYLRIRANGDINSLFSIPVRISNELPQITYTRNYVSWGHVLGADEYVVTVNPGTVYEEIFRAYSGTNAIRIDLTRRGNNRIEFMAYGAGGEPWHTFGTYINVYAYRIT